MDEPKKEYYYIPVMPESQKKIRSRSFWIVFLGAFVIVLMVLGIVGVWGAIKLISYLAGSANTHNVVDGILLLNTYGILAEALVFFFEIVLFAFLMKIQLETAKDVKYIRNYLKNKG